MGEALGILTKGELETAREAARLAKADLTTLMVREFPELQGVMGGIYLRAQGDPPANVAEAVRWHYHPVSIEEGSAPGPRVQRRRRHRLRRGLAGRQARHAGRLLRPRPRAHRAAAIPTACAARPRARCACSSTSGRPTRRSGGPACASWPRPPSPATRASSSGRRRTSCATSSPSCSTACATCSPPAASPPDEVEAVLGAREPDALDDPHEAWRRLQALHRVRLEATEDFEALAVAFKRAKNILGEKPPQDVDTALLQEPAERELHQAVARLRGVNGGYESRLRSLSGLRAPVDHFFDDVLVMAEDPRLRANRLGLLSQALSLFYRIADISKLGG